MQKVNLEQNTDEWLDFRKDKLGGSDVPVVMGVSPWATPLDLYNIKKGLKVMEVSEYATSLGHDMEPLAREFFEIKTGIKATPIVAVSEEHPWLMASLDGFSEEHNLVLEIKCPGKADHDTARQGCVPQKYHYQVQTQLLVTGAERAVYLSYPKDDLPVMVDVKPDPEAFGEIVRETRAFMKRLLSNQPPELSERDFLYQHEGKLETLVTELREAQRAKSVLEEKIKAVKEEISTKLRHNRVICNDMKIQVVERRGQIDYKRVPSLEGVDLEEYRKPSTKSLSFFDTLK